jgi:DNA polymerase-3 subunit epsilon
VNVLERLFGGRAALAPDERRWVVLDVETSGLDMRHDHLLAIAAVALQVGGEAMPRVAIADSFEAVLQRQSASADKDNILLHGIGVGAQRAGAPAKEVLVAFERWIGAAPLLAFHAVFDQTMIERAMKAALGHSPRNHWLDLAPVATGLHPKVRARALDDWLAHFGIECAVRHQAAADALATAELLQRLWPAAKRQGCASFRGLSELARERRWLRDSG